MRPRHCMAALIAVLAMMASNGTRSAESESTGAPPFERPMAVLAYADWCLNCKLIKPKLAVLKPEFSENVQWVKLDVTNKNTKKRAKALAKELGIARHYFANKKTGLVMLIDRAGEKVGELRHYLSEDEMRERLNAMVEGKVPAPLPPDPNQKSATPFAVPVLAMMTGPE